MSNMDLKRAMVLKGVLEQGRVTDALSGLETIIEKWRNCACGFEHAKSFAAQLAGTVGLGAPPAALARAWRTPSSIRRQKCCRDVRSNGTGVPECGRSRLPYTKNDQESRRVDWVRTVEQMLHSSVDGHSDGCRKLRATVEKSVIVAISLTE